jgi:hypothetical protein
MTDLLQLFFTYPHPSAGSDEEFPLPDNLQKMQRSVQNAETVGLFVPEGAPVNIGHRLNRRHGYMPAPLRRPGHFAPPARALDSPTTRQWRAVGNGQLTPSSDGIPEDPETRAFLGARDSVVLYRR